MVKFKFTSGQIGPEGLLAGKGPSAGTRAFWFDGGVACTYPNAVGPSGAAESAFHHPIEQADPRVAKGACPPGAHTCRSPITALARCSKELTGRVTGQFLVTSQFQLTGHLWRQQLEQALAQVEEVKGSLQRDRARKVPFALMVSPGWLPTSPRPPSSLLPEDWGLTRADECACCWSQRHHTHTVCVVAVCVCVCVCGGSPLLSLTHTLTQTRSGTARSTSSSRSPRPSSTISRASSPVSHPDSAVGLHAG